MKTKSYLSIVALLLSTSLSAQVYNNPYNELRSVFGSLTFQNPYPGLLHYHLYDMSAHMSSDDFYFPIVADTSNAANFFYLYEAMYHAADDTNTMMPVDTLIKKSFGFQSDTIPILIFNYSFFQIRDTALKVPGYFLLDTANNKVLDHPSPIGNPYIEREIFAAGMPSDELYFTTVTYRIDPGLIFFGPTRAI
jgi:hypothetical protein